MTKVGWGVDARLFTYPVGQRKDDPLRHSNDHVTSLILKLHKAKKTILVSHQMSLANSIRQQATFFRCASSFILVNGHHNVN